MVRGADGVKSLEGEGIVILASLEKHFIGYARIPHNIYVFYKNWLMLNICITFLGIGQVFYIKCSHSIILTITAG